MRRAPWCAFVLLFTLLGLAPSSRAGLPVPNPGTSTFSSVMVACPGGDFAYLVTVRDNTAGPLNGALVTIDFSGCPNVHFCAPGPNTQYTFVTPNSVQLATDVTGQAIFRMEAGGPCTSAIQIYAEPGCCGIKTPLTDGVSHSPVSLASTDQDGDLAVGSLDAALMAGKSSTDPTADLNQDGVHDAADNSVLASHLGHACQAIPTPVGRRSWGSIKLIYR